MSEHVFWSQGHLLSIEELLFALETAETTPQMLDSWKVPKGEHTSENLHLILPTQFSNSSLNPVMKTLSHFPSYEHSQEVYCHYTDKNDQHASTTAQSIHTTTIPFIWVVSTVINTITHVPLENTEAIVAFVFPRSAGSRAGPGLGGSSRLSCIWKRGSAMITFMFCIWSFLFSFDQTGFISLLQSRTKELGH